MSGPSDTIRRDPARLAESRIPLAGTSNVRDLAGYPAASGQVIGRSRLLRGEVLAAPGDAGVQGRYDPEHAEQFAALGLRTIIDLRAEHEVAATTSAWCDATGAALVALPIAEGGEGAETSWMQALLSGRASAFTEQDMARFYLDVLDRRADTFAAAITVLADPSRLPALIHCSAGKDRTGLAIALVLELVGTPRRVVLDDYVLTGQLRPNRVGAYASWLKQHDIAPAAAEILFATPRLAMSGALDHLDREWGGAETYLLRHGDLRPDVPERLRSALLVPPP